MAKTTHDFYDLEQRHHQFAEIIIFILSIFTIFSLIWLQIYSICNKPPKKLKENL